MADRPVKVGYGGVHSLLGIVNIVLDDHFENFAKVMTLQEDQADS